MNLKEYLFYKGLSAAQFGRIADLSGAYISFILSGKGKPTEKTLRIIERATKGIVTAENAFAPTKLPDGWEQEGDKVA